MYIPGTTYLHILLHCTLYLIAHLTPYFISLFVSYFILTIFIYIHSRVLFHSFYCFYVIFYPIIIFIFLHFPLSGPVLTNISLLIIPCMIVYVTNNKEPWTLNLIVGRSFSWLVPGMIIFLLSALTTEPCKFPSIVQKAYILCQFKQQPWDRDN